MFKKMNETSLTTNKRSQAMRAATFLILSTAIAACGSNHEDPKTSSGTTQNTTPPPVVNNPATPTSLPPSTSAGDWICGGQEASGQWRVCYQAANPTVLRLHGVVQRATTRICAVPVRDERERGNANAIQIYPENMSCVDVAPNQTFVNINRSDTDSVVIVRYTEASQLQACLRNTQVTCPQMIYVANYRQI